MAKFRLKLKNKSKAKKKTSGCQSLSNPQITKHRLKANSRFFSSKFNSNTHASDLTSEALSKHDELQDTSLNTKNDPSINELTGNLKTFSMSENEDIWNFHEEKSMRTCQSFATNFSACTNMTFSKLIEKFNPDSQLHKEMLAILAALTEIIKEKKGAESNTEYYLALMETIQCTKEDSDIIASVMLLSMGIKSVPEAILRKTFSETVQILLQIMQKFMGSDNQLVTRNIIGCLSVLLRSQEYSQWQLSSTFVSFDAILGFCLHSKPKIRKAAQHAIMGVLLKSCFIRTQSDELETATHKRPFKCHPAESRVVEFCVKNLSVENIGQNQTILLHSINFLQNAMLAFSLENVKLISERLLSIMSTSNILIRTCCLHTFFSFFKSKPTNLSESLLGKLIAALYEFQPDRNDARQVLAWITVLKESYICLYQFNSISTINSSIKLINICVTDIWLSNYIEVISGTTNCLKEILEEIVQPSCEDGKLVKEAGDSIRKIIEIFTNALLSPFNQATKHLLILFGVLFKAAGVHFGNDFKEALIIFGNRYDDQSSLRVHLEHTVLAAISSVRVDIIIECIPLADKNGNILLNKSWMLPLMREGLVNSSFEFFNNYILKLAHQCFIKWQNFKAKNDTKQAHINELLCCQLWGLFPGFCRKPSDMKNFKLVAKTLGMVLNNNAELRSPILDGFKELFGSLENEEDKAVLAIYAKNFLPRLFNIYTTKPETGYENEIRIVCFEVIEQYLKITLESDLNVLFDTALGQLESQKPGTFMYDMLSDIVEAMAVYQTKDEIRKLFDSYITGNLEKTDVNVKNIFILRRKVKKAYTLLHKLLESSSEGCMQFYMQNEKQVQHLLLTTPHKTLEGTQRTRLSCMKLILEKQSETTLKDKLSMIRMCVSELLVEFNNDSIQKDKFAVDVLVFIGSIFQNEDSLDEFVNNLSAGLGGDNQLVANTIMSLRVVIGKFYEFIDVETVTFVLEQIIELLISKQRNIVNACIHYLITAIKTYKTALLYHHLPLIVKALTLMVPDTKRYSRLSVGYLYKKLSKKFTTDEVIKLVPGSDELTHKRLKKIKKDLARTKTKTVDKDENDENDLEKKSMTIDDILNDSDSNTNEEDSDDEKEESKNDQVFIRETADNIIDLADLDEFSKVSGNKITNAKTESFTKKDKNRGFKTAADGRLIIKDYDVSSDDEIEEITGFVNASKKRIYEENSDEDSEKNPTKKKPTTENMSSKSSSKSGIHRTLSVKSGWSNTSKSTVRKDSNLKKDGGDKKKQGKLEPYAYIPVNRHLLNKKKRTSKKSSQFKNVMKVKRTINKTKSN